MLVERCIKIMLMYNLNAQNVIQSGGWLRKELGKTQKVGYLLHFSSLLGSDKNLTSLFLYWLTGLTTVKLNYTILAHHVCFLHSG